MNKEVTICKRDTCLSIKGPWADIVAVALVIAIAVYSLYQLKRLGII